MNDCEIEYDELRQREIDDARDRTEKAAVRAARRIARIRYGGLPFSSGPISKELYNIITFSVAHRFGIGINRLRQVLLDLNAKQWDRYFTARFGRNS